MYTAVAVIIIAGLIAVLTCLRYAQDKKKKALSFKNWLLKKRFRLDPSVQREKKSPGRRKLAFYGLAGTFIFMAATGFLFSLFGLIRLQGIPLALHVAGGGLFAAAVTAAALTGTKDHHPDDFDEKSRLFSRRSRRTAAYWLFLLASFLLMATALLMMLPFFHFTTIRTAFFIHRWSALAGLAAVLVWAETFLITEDKNDTKS